MAGISEITSRLRQFYFERTGKAFIVQRTEKNSWGFTRRITLGPGEIYGVVSRTFPSKKRK